MCLSVSASFVIFQKSETCYISLVFPEAPLKRFLQNFIWVYLPHGRITTSAGPGVVAKMWVPLINIHMLLTRAVKLRVNTLKN